MMLKTKTHKATPADANIIGPVFDLYRIFYKQKSNVEEASAGILRHVSKQMNQ